jgi:hypothetical protein
MLKSSSTSTSSLVFTRWSLRIWWSWDRGMMNPSLISFKIQGHQKPMLQLISQWPVSWIGFSRTFASHQGKIFFTRVRELKSPCSEAVKYWHPCPGSQDEPISKEGCFRWKFLWFLRQGWDRLSRMDQEQ